MTRPSSTSRAVEPEHAGSRRSAAGAAATSARRPAAAARRRGVRRAGLAAAALVTTPAARPRAGAPPRRSGRPGRRSSTNMSIEAQAGASSTVSPAGRESAARRRTTCVHGPSVGALDLDDRDIGGVSRQRVADQPRGRAEQHHGPQPPSASPRRARRSVAPLASPPAIQTTRVVGRQRGSRPRAGWSPWSRRRKSTPSMVATWAMRCASGRNARNPSRTAAAAPDAAGPGQRRGGQRVGDVVRRGRRDVADRGQHDARRWLRRPRTPGRRALPSTTPSMPGRRASPSVNPTGRGRRRRPRRRAAARSSR